MLVDKGAQPQHADENVRFRTTYYFRVFDYCASVNEATADPRFRHILVDSLYRFRMTGKANALANEVKFESGTLKSWEIDPFGATVVFDRDLGQFRYQSQDESRALARRQLAKDTVGDLIKLQQQLDSVKGPNPYAPKIKTGIESAIDEIAKSLPLTTPGGAGSQSSALGPKAKGYIQFKANPSDGDTITLNGVAFTLKTSAAAASEIQIGADVPTTLDNIKKTLNGSKLAQVARNTYSDDGHDTLTVTHKIGGEVGNAFAIAASRASVSGKTLAGGAKASPCPTGFEVQRGFQLLGPQGVSTFNQDDRLIMAMSSSARPLASTLSEISKRVLEQEPVASATILPLVEERLRISEAQRRLLGKDPTAFGSGDVDEIIKALNPEDEKAPKP